MAGLNGVVDGGGALVGGCGSDILEGGGRVEDDSVGGAACMLGAKVVEEDIDVEIPWSVGLVLFKATLGGEM